MDLSSSLHTHFEISQTLKLSKLSHHFSSATSTFSFSSASSVRSLSQVFQAHTLLLKCFHSKHKFWKNILIFNLYSILQRECTQGEIWMLNHRSRASASYSTKVTNGRKATLRTMQLHVSTILTYKFILPALVLCLFVLG